MRRVHVEQVVAGELALSADQAHHVRDVLRLGEGDSVEVFDDAGRAATASIVRCARDAVVLIVASPVESPRPRFQWMVASALPKGPRADWMIEKLSELGADRFIPLATARSVVLPEGKGKHERWVRLATESAKQSRRAGVMRIEPLTALGELLKNSDSPAWYFSTAVAAVPIAQAIAQLPADCRGLLMLIGPEGGWTDEEIAAFAQAGISAVSLGATVLRIETAAVAAGALASALVVPRLS